MLLEETLLKEGDLSLILLKLSTLLTSITTTGDKGAIWTVKDVKAEERNCLFSKLLLGATMQDGSIREKRSDFIFIYFLWFDFYFYFILISWTIKRYMAATNVTSTET